MHKLHRRSIRLKEYDYTQPGAYFVTIVAGERLCIFGEIVGGDVQLSQMGEIACKEWERLPHRFKHLRLDEFIVMPNHVHGIIVLDGLSDVGAGLRPAPTIVNRYGLPEIIRAFKAFSSRRINELRGTPGTQIWQRNYYEHVIRNEYDLSEIREYIVRNPMKWDFDTENPDRL